MLQGITADKMLAGDMTGDERLELTALLSEYGLCYCSIAINLWTNLLAESGNSSAMTAMERYSSGS